MDLIVLSKTVYALLWVDIHTSTAEEQNKHLKLYVKLQIIFCNLRHNFFISTTVQYEWGSRWHNVIDILTGNRMKKNIHFLKYSVHKHTNVSSNTYTVNIVLNFPFSLESYTNDSRGTLDNIRHMSYEIYHNGQPTISESNIS